MRYFENDKPYVINLPRRPSGGHIVLSVKGRGKDVVEGEYYAAFAKATPPDKPLLREVDLSEGSTEDMNRVVYSQSKLEADAKPVSSEPTPLVDDVSETTPNLVPELVYDAENTQEDLTEGSVPSREEVTLTSNNDEQPRDTEEHLSDTVVVSNVDDEKDTKDEDVYSFDKSVAVVDWIKVHGNVAKTNLRKTPIFNLHVLGSILGITIQDGDTKPKVSALILKAYASLTE